MTVQTERKIIVIAGPNGAGKTTFAEEFLPKEANCPIFINADLIAAGLALPDLAIAKVCQRVREGGHNVPEPTIRRRFAAGLRNFEIFIN
jgi:predicted ABC-type ATPase